MAEDCITLNMTICSPSVRKNDIPTFIRRNRVYLSGKTTLVVSASAGEHNSVGQTTLYDAGNEIDHDDDETINVGSDSTHLSTTPNLAIKINDEKAGRGIAEEEVAQPGATEGLRVRSAAARVKVFPPILSSLNRYGRPRFSLEMVREAGRLRIVAVPNYFPEMVRTRSGGDRLSIRFVDACDEEYSSNSFGNKSVNSSLKNLYN